MILLSQRMQSVVSLLTPGLFVTDIGCDHAHVSIYLMQQQLAKGVIAMDIGEGPLKIAQTNIRNEGYENKIETRLSDGAKALAKGEAQAAIIAGMGGMLMEKILSDSSDIFHDMRELILQPQSDLDHFRRYLYSNGYRIVAEKMVFEEGKYYPMMKVIPTSSGDNQQPLSDEAYAYGPYLLGEKNPILYDYLMWEKDQKLKILSGLQTGPATEKKRHRIAELMHEINLNTKAVGYF